MTSATCEACCPKVRTPLKLPFVGAKLNLSAGMASTSGTSSCSSIVSCWLYIWLTDGVDGAAPKAATAAKSGNARNVFTGPPEFWWIGVIIRLKTRDLSGSRWPNMYAPPVRLQLCPDVQSYKIREMKGNPKVISALNEALKEELTAINQYFLHAEMCENWQYARLAAHIKKESIDEMKHAEALMER